MALVLDTSTAAHTAVAAEIEAALPPRQYRVERFTAAATEDLAALRGRPVTIVAVGPSAVEAARAAAPDAPLVFCQVGERHRFGNRVDELESHLLQPAQHLADRVLVARQPSRG